MKSRALEIDEDFTGAFLDGGNLLITSAGTWTLSGTGTESLTIPDSEANTPGIIQLRTDTTINDTARLVFGSNTVCLANEIVELSFRFRLFGTANTQVQIGVFDNSAGAASSPVARYLYYDTSGPDFYASFTQQSGSDFITTDVAGINEWRTFTAKLSGDGALGTFTITDEDGVVLARGAHDAEFVDATPVFLLVRVETLTSASRGVDLDRIYLRTRDLTR